MKHEIHIASYFLGATSGFLVALLLGVVVWRIIIYPRIEAEVESSHVSVAIEYLDDRSNGGNFRQFMVDSIANTYADAPPGALSHDVRQRIEAAASRHPDLAKEIARRNGL